MHSIRRSCQSALQSSNATRLFAHTSQRAFSRSAAHHRGDLPVFQSSSTPELTALLSATNAKVLLPLHLTKDQAKLVFKKENKAKLESEPIEITLGDVTLPLEHIDRNRDVPARFQQLREIVAKSSTEADWENVLRVMEGYENAGIRIKTQQHAMIVRRMSRAGMQHLILKALQRAGKTGLRLSTREVVSAVLRAVRDKAALADWELDQLKKSLSMAEQVVELMELDEHLGKTHGADDLRTSPVVVALPLEMAAEMAYRHDGDVEKVKRYAVRLMNSLAQHDFMTRLNELAAIPKQDLPTHRKLMDAFWDLAVAATEKISVWNGLSTARTVLEDDMPMAAEAERVQKELYAALQAAREWMRTLETQREDKPDREPREPYEKYLEEAMSKCEDGE
ncbi:hypothetical protein K458DRAFT_292227 [Lentithecium fluviatile CBS 122367]|uniref:Uncharacterized protein n=1 Tax=Lentithecium fluviatile CBS 122367 TaxID=1168545 RepID=A0A6G1JFJ6_9PLEO|nr:hypothetical protein K458DRAFT_292227 [Lentithecium fluviatile CBS 122367]